MVSTDDAYCRWMRSLTHEQVIRVGIGSADAKELHEVMKLAMNVSTYGDGAFLKWLKVSWGDAPPVVSWDIFCWKLTTGCTFDSSCNTSRA